MILFSASYHAGTPSADLRAYTVCAELKRRGYAVEIVNPADGVGHCRAKISSLDRRDALYIQKWAGQMHTPEELRQCLGVVVYDFDDMTSSQKHLDMLNRCDAAVVGTKFLATQIESKPVLVAPSPIEPELFGRPIPYGERMKGVVVAKYGLKPYLGKLANLAPRLNEMLARHGYSMWFLGAHKPREYQRLRELFPDCHVYPLVRMGKFYELQVPVIKRAMWGFVPYDKRCRGKSATSALTMMACGVPCQAFVYGECEELFGPRLRRWIVRDDDRFFENAERLMTDPSHGERFIQVSEERVQDYSLERYCDKLVEFLRGLGASL